jgi:hypothetical protein
MMWLGLHSPPSCLLCISLDALVAKRYLVAMSQPVKLSDDLVLDARLVGKVARRSIAAQVEYWAGLGRAIELVLQGRQALALSQAAAARPLSECLEAVDSPAGRLRVAEYLESRPYPHYAPAPDSPGLLVRVEQDGTRTVGRFVHREFQPAVAREK